MRNGRSIARALSIAGFYGVYTDTNEHYSLSYNVRENFKNNRTEAIWENLRLELDKEYTPLQNLMLETITSNQNFESAIIILSTRKVNAPGYIILMNA